MAVSVEEDVNGGLGDYEVARGEMLQVLPSSRISSVPMPGIIVLTLSGALCLFQDGRPGCTNF